MASAGSRTITAGSEFHRPRSTLLAKTSVPRLVFRLGHGIADDFGSDAVAQARGRRRKPRRPPAPDARICYAAAPTSVSAGGTAAARERVQRHRCPQHECDPDVPARCAEAEQVDSVVDDRHHEPAEYCGHVVVHRPLRDEQWPREISLSSRSSETSASTCCWRVVSPDGPARVAARGPPGIAVMPRCFILRLAAAAATQAPMSSKVASAFLSSASSDDARCAMAASHGRPRLVHVAAAPCQSPAISCPKGLGKPSGATTAAPSRAPSGAGAGHAWRGAPRRERTSMVAAASSTAATTMAIHWLNTPSR